MSILIYKITGSALLVAILYAVNGVSNVVFGMVSGVACKYISDKKIMVICDFGRGLCVSILAFLFMLGKLEVWMLFFITFCNSSFESFRTPSSMSITPKLLPKEKMDYDIVAVSSGSRITELAGYAAAPFIIGITGLSGAIFIDAVTFFICGILVMLVRLKDTINTDGKNDYLKDFKEGFKYVRADSLIFSLVIFAAVVNALMVPLNALQAPFVEEILHKGSEALSVMSIASLLGMTLITVFAPKIKEMIGGRWMFISGGIIVGILYVFMVLIGSLPDKMILPILAVNLFCMGIGCLGVSFPLQITMLKSVPGEFLPRIASIFNAGALCVMPVASCIVGIVSDFLPLA